MFVGLSKLCADCDSAEDYRWWDYRESSKVPTQWPISGPQLLPQREWCK